MNKNKNTISTIWLIMIFDFVLHYEDATFVSVLQIHNIAKTVLRGTEHDGYVLFVFIVELPKFHEA